MVFEARQCRIILVFRIRTFGSTPALQKSQIQQNIKNNPLAVVIYTFYLLFVSLGIARELYKKMGEFKEILG